MNKKVDEEFKGIKDVYVLQCICTQLKEDIKKLEEGLFMCNELKENYKACNKNAVEFINNPWKMECDDEKCNEMVHKKKRDLLNILEGKNEYNK